MVFERATGAEGGRANRFGSFIGKRAVESVQASEELAPTKTQEVVLKGVDELTVPTLIREEGQELRTPGQALGMKETEAYLD